MSAQRSAIAWAATAAHARGVDTDLGGVETPLPGTCDMSDDEADDISRALGWLRNNFIFSANASYLRPFCTRSALATDSLSRDSDSRPLLSLSVEVGVGEASVVGFAGEVVRDRAAFSEAASTTFCATKERREGAAIFCATKERGRR